MKRPANALPSHSCFAVAVILGDPEPGESALHLGEVWAVGQDEADAVALAHWSKLGPILSMRLMLVWSPPAEAHAPAATRS